jgi:hypothetical protein
MLARAPAGWRLQCLAHVVRSAVTRWTRRRPGVGRRVHGPSTSPQQRLQCVRMPEYREGAMWAVQPGPTRVTGTATLATVQDLFCEPIFKNKKLPKTSTKSKISKNRSCRGTTDLQLSQRATWCLSNGLSGNVGWSWQNSRPGLLFKTALTKFLGIFHLEFEMPLYIWNVLPKITKKFYIGLFWTSIVKFGERTRKPNQPFRDLGFWPCIWIFTKGFCAIVCIIMSNMIRS